MKTIKQLFTGKPAKPVNRFIGEKRNEREALYKRKKVEPEIIDEGRRSFLKKSVLLVGGVAAGGIATKEVLELAEKWIGNNDSKTNNEPELETEEQMEIEAVDAESLRTIIDYKKPGKIDLNPGVIKKVEHFWHDQYGTGKLRKSFEDAYRNMGEWQVYLEQEFAKEFDQAFADKYGEENRQKALEVVYLAIPESHWQINAVSGAKATGPYQFMKETAESYGLKVGGSVDERKDPVKSARACAKCIKDLYEVAEDWDLALSGYNGGYIWRYIKEAKKQNEQPSYPGFLEWAEKKINLAKDEARNDRRLKTEAEKEKSFNREVRGYFENLNYPAKFNAVIGQIKAGLVSEQADTLAFKNLVVEPRKISTKKHKVKKGETVFGLSKKNHVSPEQLEAENQYLAKRSLRVGDILNIPAPGNERPTLDVISRKRGVSREHLAKLNPAVNLNSPLPDGYKVRI